MVFSDAGVTEMSVISGIEGVLEEKGIDHIVIRLGGILLNVHMPTFDLGEIGEKGSIINLKTHLVVKEDDLQLYGFATDSGSNLFAELLTVSGVGPKVALAILSVMPLEQVIRAIIAGDANSLSQAQGVGKRTAERIVIDLRGKIEEKIGASMDLTNVSATPSLSTDPALSALQALGYSILEARQALSVETEPELSIEERIRRALQRMGN